MFKLDFQPTFESGFQVKAAFPALQIDLLKRSIRPVLSSYAGAPLQIRPVRLWSYLDFMGKNLAVAVAAGRLFSGLTCLKYVVAALIGECSVRHPSRSRG